MNHQIPHDGESDRRPRPNFILIGAQKSGSTALYHTLRKHPEIFMPRWKEPMYFLFQEGKVNCENHHGLAIVSSWEDYLELFSEVREERAIGEASVMYLSAFHPEQTAARIKQQLPNVRLIAVLRNPVERAYSAYTFFISRGFETLATFQEALAAEDGRIKQGAQPGLYYKQNGLYYQNLSRFFQYFTREQLRVYLYEDWDRNPQAVLRDIYEFLNIDSGVCIQPRRRAVTSYIRSRRFKYALEALSRTNLLIPAQWRTRFIRMLMRLNQVKPAPLDNACRQEMIEYFRSDIIQLQGLLGRDLTHWLS